MKKLLLLSSVLLGVIPASQGGVHFGIGIGLPVPLPLPIVIGRPPAVVIQPALPPVCEPAAPVVVAPPVVCAPPRAYYYYPQPYYIHPHGFYARRGWEHGRRW